MKDLIKNSLIIFAVIMLTIGLVDGLMIKDWSELGLYLEIVFVSIVVSLIRYFINKLQIDIYLCQLFWEFILVLIVVLFFGYLFKWYIIQGIGIMCAVILFVYIICFFLGVIGTKREIDIINEKLKERKKRGNEGDENINEKNNY